MDVQGQQAPRSLYNAGTVGHSGTSGAPLSPRSQRESDAEMDPFLGAPAELVLENLQIHSTMMPVPLEPSALRLASHYRQPNGNPFAIQMVGI
jgi:hypothetical protein